MSFRATAAIGLIALWLAGCASSGPPQSTSDGASAATPERPIVLLISLDGFRWDFRARTETPHLDRLAKNGVTAERMIPSFPSKTFPNHYTIVTGLYPGNHGVVANNMWDPVFGVRYSLGRREEVANQRWYSGEPIWVTAQRHGLLTNPHFWPGSEAAIGGVRPTYWEAYDGDQPNRTRIDLVLDRLALPADERPAFATLYFSLIDDAAHAYNPDEAPEVASAIREADALIGYLVEGFGRRGLADTVDVILVSDHGMSANSLDRAVRLDDYVDLEVANLVDWNPVAALWPKPDRVEEIYGQLHGAHPHLFVYRKDEIPERYHYRSHRRVPPILAVADEGWVITTSERLERQPERFPGGSHGYDNQLVSMGALFLASGPSFATGTVSEPFQNVHVYELMCHLLGIEPAPNDGDLEAVRHLLRPSR